MGEGVQGRFENEAATGPSDQFLVQRRYRNQLRVPAQQCLNRELLHQRCVVEQVAV
jgi:hypothetical protein